MHLVFIKKKSIFGQKNKFKEYEAKDIQGKILGSPRIFIHTL